MEAKLAELKAEINNVASSSACNLSVMQAYQFVLGSDINKKNIPQLVDTVVSKVKKEQESKEQPSSVLDSKYEECQ